MKLTFRDVQCSICRGKLGFNSPLVDDDPLLVTAKFGLGSDMTPQKSPKSKFVVISMNKCQTLFRPISKNFFIMVCILTATPVLLLSLITFK